MGSNGNFQPPAHVEVVAIITDYDGTVFSTSDLASQVEYTRDGQMMVGTHIDLRKERPARAAEMAQTSEPNVETLRESLPYCTQYEPVAWAGQGPHYVEAVRKIVVSGHELRCGVHGRDGLYLGFDVVVDLFSNSLIFARAHGSIGAPALLEVTYRHR